MMYRALLWGFNFMAWMSVALAVVGLLAWALALPPVEHSRARMFINGVITAWWMILLRDQLRREIAESKS